MYGAQNSITTQQAGKLDFKGKVFFFLHFHAILLLTIKNYI